MANALKGIAAAIGVVDALLGERDRLGHLAQRQLQLAQIAGARSGIIPILLSTARSSETRIGWTASSSRPSARRQKPACAQDERLIRLGDRRHGPLPRRIEEARQRRQIRTERAELLSDVELIATRDPRPIDLVERLLMPARLAAVEHRLEQRRHLLQRVGLVLLRQRLEVLVQPRVPRPPRLGMLLPQLRPEMLPHQRMRVHLVRRVAARRRDQPTLRAAVSSSRSQPPSSSPSKMLRQAWDRRRPAAASMAPLRRRAVEQTEQPQHLDLGAVLAEALGERRHHPPRMTGLLRKIHRRPGMSPASAISESPKNSQLAARAG